MASKDDRDLLEAWGAGDRVAGNEFVTRYFAAVHRFLSGKVGPSTVDDLTQQTFLACLERRNQLRGGSSYRAYLLGIARNLLLMHYRAKNTTGRVLEQVQGAALDELEASPSGVVAMREEQRVLLRALRRIPLDLQLTLELYYWEDMAVAEVAAITNVAPGTVKSRLSRARAMLGDALASVGESPEMTDSTLQSLGHWVHAMRGHTDGSS